MSPLVLHQRERRHFFFIVCFIRVKSSSASKTMCGYFCDPLALFAGARTQQTPVIGTGFLGESSNASSFFLYPSRAYRRYVRSGSTDWYHAAGRVLFLLPTQPPLIFHSMSVCLSVSRRGYFLVFFSRVLCVCVCFFCARSFDEFAGMRVNL